ncbi:MAG: hypothetical protein IPM24_12885 [Bryobacterales bacterium]|nr:hypothetical protein [Bryobacterales bacterium]
MKAKKHWLPLMVAGLLLAAGGSRVASQTLSSAYVEHIRLGDRLVASVGAPAVRFQDWVFTDPWSPYHPFRKFADLMHSHAITNGCWLNPPQFCADSDITRNSVAVFAIRAWSVRRWGAPEAWSQHEPHSTVPYFDDVPPSHGDFKYIQKMWELGITAGCGYRRYCPSHTTSNKDIAVFSIRARTLADKNCVANPWPSTCLVPANQTQAYFTDVGTQHPNFYWAQLAVELQGMNPSVAVLGCPSGPGYFCGETASKRAQIAAFVVRTILADETY